MNWTERMDPRYLYLNEHPELNRKEMLENENFTKSCTDIPGHVNKVVLQPVQYDYKNESICYDISCWQSKPDKLRHGCIYVTSSMLDGRSIIRHGQTIFEGVEMAGCGQGEEMAPIQFQKNNFYWQTVKHSSFWGSHGHGVEIMSASKINFIGNIVYDVGKVGIAIDKSHVLEIHNNIVALTVNQYPSPAGTIEGAYLVCSMAKHYYCHNINMRGNIAADSFYSGFIVPGHRCGDTKQMSFRDNVAHSIGTGSSGHGVIFYDYLNQEDCTEISHFKAYKIQNAAIAGSLKGKKVYAKNNVVIDSAMGFGIMKKDKGIADQKVQIEHNHIYGASPSPGGGGICGFIMPVFAEKKKEHHVLKLSSRPIYKSEKQGGFEGYSYVMYNKFTDFKSGSVVVCANQSPDYNNPVVMRENLFHNVQSWARMGNPQSKWANPEDCGTWPCSAPWNTWIYTIGNKYKGSRPEFDETEFTIIPNNPGFSPHIPMCKPDRGNNWHCTNPFIGILHFQSEDADKWDRSSQPITLTQYNTTISNVLNANMDHLWDGFYTS